MTVDGWGVRSDLPERNVGKPLEDGGWRSDPPLVRMFYSNPSTYLWEDELEVTQHIAQGEGGEGGEQGDPLMPLLFALGQHKSLVEAQTRLSGNEKLLAFLDDIYIANMPDRVSEAHTIVEEELSSTHPPPSRQNQSVESWWCGP